MTIPTVANGERLPIFKGFNPYLHGARGLFAFMIVLFHVVNSKLPTWPILSAGWPLFAARSFEHGVELFFGISGIVIVGALARAKSPLLFALERVTRIYPVLWVTVLVIVVMAGLTGFENRHPPNLFVLSLNLLGATPLVPVYLVHPAAWSLSFELAFYGICAVSWALRRRIGWLSWIVILPIAVVFVALHVRVFLMPIGMTLPLLLGAHPSLARKLPPPGLCLVLFLMLWEVVCERSGGDLTYMGVTNLSPAMLSLGALALVAGTLSLAGILAGKGWLSAALNSAPLQFLGTISYSFYLWHPIVMSVVKHEMYQHALPTLLGSWSQFVFLLLVLPPSLAVAWVSQQILEKRLTKILRVWLEGGHQPSSRLIPMTAADHVAPETRVEPNPS